MSTAIITSKSQTIISKEIRQLNLRPGDRINFVTEANGRVYIQPLNIYVELSSILHKPERTPDLKIAF